MEDKEWIVVFGGIAAFLSASTVGKPPRYLKQLTITK